LIPANTPPSLPLPSVPLSDPQHNGFAPRLGFAYRVTKHWVVRRGYGLYYNANQLNLYTIGGNPPFSRTCWWWARPSGEKLDATSIPAAAMRVRGPAATDRSSSQWPRTRRSLLIN